HFITVVRHFITAVSYKLLLFDLTKDVSINLMLLDDVIRQDIHLDDADGVECFLNEEIFLELARMGYEKPPPKLKFYKAFFFAQWKFLIHTLVQCVSAKRTAWNEFSCSMASAVICLATCRKFNFSKYIFDSMVIANMRRIDKGFSGVKTPLLALMLVQPQPQATKEEEKVEVPTAPPLPSPTTLPPQEQPTTTSESSMSLLTTPMDTCATLSNKVAELEQDKHTQALEILKLKKRVKKLETKRRSKHSGLKRLRKGRIDQDVSAATKDVSALSLLCLMMKRLHDEEVEKAAARDKQEKDDLERAQVLQKQYDEKEENINWNVVAEQIQEKHLDNIKKGMTYDKVRPIFEREYKKVQTLFKPDKDVEEPKKKKSSRTYWKIIRVGGIIEAYQSFKDMLKGFDREDLVALWSLVKEKFSSVVPNVNKEKALWVELKRLFEPDADDVLWKLQRHNMFMLTEKDYPLSNGVMILMLSAKLQVEEDSEMARDLVMKIFMEANKPKSRSLDTFSNITAVGSRLMMLGKDDSAAEGVSAAEPTVFDDEEVTMTMAQTLIKMKAEKARLFDEQMDKRLHDEEVEQATARKKQEKKDLEKAKVLQQQYVDNSSQENMIVYLKNMVRYKMEHFKVEVSGSYSTQDTPTDNHKEMSEEDVKNMLKIIPVSEFKVEALQVKVGGITQVYQSFEDMLKDFDREDLDILWRLVKEKFSSTVPIVDKEKALWVELKRLFEPDADDVIWKL
nr:synaptobrevin, longin-like domain protein [Tanacetum cinerariifolium]